MKSDVWAVILTGGKSKRIGQDKSFLSIGSSYLIDSIVEKLKPIFKDIMIVGDKNEKYSRLSIQCIDDIFPGMGPLGGIYTALEVTQAEFVFVFACDMPFINTHLIKYMLGKINKNHDVIVPMLKGRCEPLHAIYSQNAKGKMLESINNKELGVHKLFNCLSVFFVMDEEIHRLGENMFFNINTEEDYNKALEMRIANKN